MSKRQRRKREKHRRHEARQRPDRLALQLATGASVTVGATLLMGGVAQAACTCNVDSLMDPTDTGHTTLRDAITSANANPGSTITFASGLSGTITLDGNQLAITAPTTVSGPGAGQLTISGDRASRVLLVNNTAATISGLKLTDGDPGDIGPGYASGGAIYAAGTDADLAVSDSIVTENHAASFGGGISVFGVGSLTITSSTISGNTIIDDPGSEGAGVFTASNEGGVPTTIRNSTVSGNSGGTYGGGAYFDFRASATVENSTVYNNSAARGGGLYHYGQIGGPGLVVTGSTITHNTATFRGGGVAGGGNSPTYTQPTLRNTIVSGNTSPIGPDLSDSSGSMSAAFSLIGGIDPNTTLNQTGPNILGQDPQLGPLGNNGGPTETQKPAATSPVIDAGSAFGLTTDERGLIRPFDAPTIANAAGGDASDIGAVELQSADVPPAPATAAKKKCKKKKKKGKKGSAQSAKKKCKKKKKK